MYQYEYEKISCKWEGYGFVNGTVYEMGDFKSIINKRASEGWKYVGYLPTRQRQTGHIQEATLIFEKETNE